MPLFLEVLCKGRRLWAVVDNGVYHSVCNRGTLDKIGEKAEVTQFSATMVDGTKVPIHGETSLQLHIAAEEETLSSDLPAAVKEVLEQYKDIMPDDIPAEVPPARTYEHEIVEELVMPFGLCNAPATFQAEMNHILRPLLDECIVLYLDEILIYSKNMKEHVEHLRKVFEILRNNKFYVQVSKSDFALN
ncbi:unnamed protein product [Closterium sp. Yama58-4]|nr:unnamed protein product [Closterium sp. Yama58-4]